MKIEVFKEELKKALIACERITRKALGLPILQNVLIRADNGVLELTTTNLETTIKCRLAAKIKKPGELTAPASFLASLVGLLSSERVDLVEEGGGLMILAQQQEHQIPTQDSQDFPIIPTVESPDSWHISGEQLLMALSQVIEIPSASQLRPEITGIYFSFKRGRVQIVGTDSFRLAEKTISTIKDGKKEGNFILPQGASRELLNILGAEKGGVKICFTSNQVLFEMGEDNETLPKITMISRLIEGAYPNYQEIIPKTSLTQIRMERELIINQVKQAGLFGGKISEVRLKAQVKEGVIKITAQSPEAGKSESTIAAQMSGNDVEIGFNYRFLLGGLNSLKGAEVLLELNSSDRAGAIKPVGDNSYVYVLMPLQLSYTQGNSS